jgi:hypothetical protein
MPDVPRGPVPSMKILPAAVAGSCANKGNISRKGDRIYAGAWREFTGFCAEHGLAPLPASPLTVVRYLTHLATLGRSVATIDPRIAAIALAHRTAGHDSPTAREDVRQVLAGIRNTHGRAPHTATAGSLGKGRGFESLYSDHF